MPIKSRTWKYDEAVAHDAPEEPGVYALWEDDEIVLIGRADGKSSTIRSRLLAHLARPEAAGTAGVSACSWEVSSRPAEREAEVLERFRASYGCMPRCNARMRKSGA